MEHIADTGVAEVDLANSATLSKKKTKLTPAQRLAYRRAKDASRSEEEWYVIARDLIYRKLAMREYSVRQLRQALQRREVPEEIAEKTLTKFCEAGLVSDLRFAQTYVQTRRAARGSASYKIKTELMRYGIANEIIAEVLADYYPEEELTIAVEIAQKKLSSMVRVPAEAQYRRTYGYLARRGFNPEQCAKAISIALAHIAEDC